MMIIRQLAGGRCTLAAAVVVTLLLTEHTAPAAQRDEKGKKPSISLKVTPSVALAPARIRLSVELRGGADDYEDFYCPAIEWDWNDETKSESVKDCAPYVAGQSVIVRRYSAEHTYQESGMYKVTLRFKRKDKVLAFATTNVQVQPGLTGR